MPKSLMVVIRTYIHTYMHMMHLKVSEVCQNVQMILNFISLQIIITNLSTCHQSLPYCQVHLCISEKKKKEIEKKKYLHVCMDICMYILYLISKIAF